MKLAAAAGVGALVLAGCGGKTAETPKAAATPVVSKPADNGIAALPAAEILARAQQALAGAKSYRLSGLVHQDGDYYRIELEVAGEDRLGSITKDGTTLMILAVDGKRLVKLDEATLAETFGTKMPKSVAARLSESWIKPDTKSYAELAEWFDVAELLKPAGRLTKGETRIINQRPVISLLDAGGDFKELYVATTGEPLPQKMSMVDGGRALFTEYGRDFPDIEAPAAKDIIDLSGKKA
ncbi:hypothetical protein ACIBSW_17180 [Actinoplanes sp. NPDC049668]|uniref:hypothetical protein n=1 Tax=unclassified Actinoplanes TaxID=2626549 RepID=UPI0033B807A4